MGICRRPQKRDIISIGKSNRTANENALLILYNMIKKALSKDVDTYARFRMREAKLAELVGRSLSSEDRWDLIVAMNELGWEVSINKTYWCFIKTSITERWASFNTSEIDELVKKIDVSARQKGVLDEDLDVNAFSHSASQIDLFYNGIDLDAEFDDDDEILEASLDDFTIWQHIYFHLVEKEVINDVYDQKESLYT